MNRRIEVVGPRLRRLLVAVLVLFACLTVNSLYLAAVTVIEWLSDQSIQNHFYLWMFLGHLVLGLLLIIPTIVYGVIHWRNARHHRNRRAVKAGYGLLLVALVVLLSGLTLTRGIPVVELKDPAARTASYWLHVITPLMVAWLFVLHRLAGKAIRWRSGGMVLVGSLVFTLLAVLLQSQDPRKWNQTGPVSAEQYFFPSLARTADGQFIKQQSLMMDGYCQECHADVHDAWSQSVHKISSFNNPAYGFSVRQTREFLQARDGNVQAVRFCAGCHDPVPFFSGAMDDPSFGDNQEDSAQAGITCSVCHSITHINSPRGNADYTIEEPLHYPFTFSKDETLQWVNRTLVKAKPEFHKQTFLKPLHQSAEFCGSCHKVHLPVELNDYRWLRGQNHYDSFLLSGVSGHGVQSFYYPDQAQSNCNGCHMQAVPSDDFGATKRGADDVLSVSNHLFPAANTAIPHLTKAPTWVNQAHQEMLQDSVRLDIIGVREGGTIDGKFVVHSKDQPIRLQAGNKYLVEVVVRTLTLGHHLTQGTADSNQLWVNARASTGQSLLAQSGDLQDSESLGGAAVDPWAHFVNAFVIDAEGQRIDRRNPENIHTQLYNNQIPPGAADVVHYLLEVPQAQTEPIDFAVALKYRKFDNTFYQQFDDRERFDNDLPITVMASASATFYVDEQQNNVSDHPDIPKWQRFNDYGIGLLRREQFRQAEEAFKEVEQLGYGAGAVNLARVYLAEGRIDEAAAALSRASMAEVSGYPWSVAYFTALVNLQNGFFDAAIAGLQDLAETRFADAVARGFDFSKDYRLLNRLALALSEKAKTQRGEANPAAQELRAAAINWYRTALQYDPENVEAHYGLAQLHQLQGESTKALKHRELYAKYRPDDNAKDVAIQKARARYPAADYAANKVVIIDLQRDADPKP